MTFRTLIHRSLRFHARAHLGVVLGAAIGSAALIGALVVGDSVRESLRERALSRLGGIHFAINARDRLFDMGLCTEEVEYARYDWGVSGQSRHPQAGLVLPGVVSTQDGSGRANFVNIIGVDRNEWPDSAGWSELWTGEDPRLLKNTPRSVTNIDSRVAREDALLRPWKTGESAMLNETLARQLGVRTGDEIIVRLHKPSALVTDAAVNSGGQDIVAMRFRAGAIIPAKMLGDFSLTAQSGPPANLFLPIDELQKKSGVVRQANLLLNGPFLVVRDFSAWDRQRFKLADWVASIFGRRGLTSRVVASIAPEKIVTVPDENGLSLLTAELDRAWSLEDVGLSVSVIEPPTTNTAGVRVAPCVAVASTRVFLEQPVAAASVTPATNLPTFRQPIERDFLESGGPGAFLIVSNRLNRLNQLSPLVTNGFGVLTYLANLIRADDQATPYSMVTAADGPYTPKDMGDDEILVNQWLADDLKVKAGDTVQMSYYVPDSGAKLLERTNTFHVRGIVPLQGIYADRTLMPDFPGVAKAESTQDWEGFPLRYKVRDKDEAYWRAYRGTPKAFITLAAGQAMWASRFGSLTAVRYPVPTNMTAEVCREVVYRNLIANLKPSDVGLHVVPVREQALKAADQAQDFGQLFLGFSFFLVVAALMLMALLFQFGLEQRAREIGTFLALGFTPKQVRRLLLGEGVMLALAGGVLGAIGGLAYAKAMIWGLTTVWRSAVGETALAFHWTIETLIIGAGASTVVATGTIWLTLRRQARQPAAMLLAGEVGSPKVEGRRPKEIRNQGANVRSRAAWVAVGTAVGAAGIVGWALAKGDTANAGAFFGAGALLLVAGLAAVAAWLRRLEKSEGRSSKAEGNPKSEVRNPKSEHAALGPVTRIPHPASRESTTSDFGLWTLGLRSCARRRTRSLATVALLACGCFVIVSIGVFRLDANRDALSRSSGTGGFAFIGETTMPVGQELNSRSGLESFGLDPKEFAGVNFVPFRVHAGDEASCLNLNRPQQPRLLGVRPEMLAGRFTFSAVAGGDVKKGWELLSVGGKGVAGVTTNESRTNGLLTSVATNGIAPAATEIPAVGDANAIEWALGRKIGDTLDFVDENGRAFKVRLVGAVANSILQGSLIIDEAAFTRLYPSESGYRYFLVDTPTNSAARVSSRLTRAMEDEGLELMPTVRRLDELNAVQNTYLGTFQVLGGLGLLLGSAGLGVVVLRNVLERRGELGVLVAVGFRRRTLHQLVLFEHGALLALGLAVGIIAAVVAVLPALLTPGMQLPLGSLALTLGAVLLNGAAWAWMATRFALRGDLLAALREE